MLAFLLLLDVDVFAWILKKAMGYNGLIIVDDWMLHS